MPARPRICGRCCAAACAAFSRPKGRGIARPPPAVEPLIDALVERYRETGLVNDAAYAAGRARRGVTQGRSLRRIAAGLAAKGVDAADTAAAIASLRDEAADPELAAAIAFARRRRLGPFRRDPHPRDAELELRRAELAAFARAGFSRRTAELRPRLPRRGGGSGFAGGR